MTSDEFSAVKLYGIANCDSVKKARALLDARGVRYVFHDYKKLGVPEIALRRWVAVKGRDTILNRKGTTWRALDDAIKAGVVDDESAIAVMLNHSSTIKRPIIVSEDGVIVGMDESAIAAL